MTLIVSKEEDKAFDFSQHPSTLVGEPRKLVTQVNYLPEKGCLKPCSKCVLSRAFSHEPPCLYWA